MICTYADQMPANTVVNIGQILRVSVDYSVSFGLIFEKHA